MKESNSPRSSVGNRKATCDLAQSKPHEQTTPREERLQAETRANEREMKRTHPFLKDQPLKSAREFQ